MNKTLLLTGALLCVLAGCRATTTTDDPPPGAATSTAATPSAAATVSQCSNPYYPIGTNVRREYRTSFTKSKLPASNYTESFSEVTDTGFVQRQQVGGEDNMHVERRWGCGREGLGSQDYTDISVSQSNFKFKSLAHQGVLVPPPADWKRGGVWEYRYDVSGAGQLGNAGADQRGAPSIETKGTIKVRNEIVAEEQVTVPAGNFHAWKVQSTITQDLQTKMGGMNVPTNITLKMDSWYAKDVGLIKSETKDLGATTELTSFRRD